MRAAEKHRGFAFVQFEEKEDAKEAIDNMNNAELFGRVLKVNIAKPDAIGKGSHRPDAPPRPRAHRARSPRRMLTRRAMPRAVWESQADNFFKGGAGGDDAAQGGDP